jgi:hypothetical protein
VNGRWATCGQYLYSNAHCCVLLLLLSPVGFHHAYQVSKHQQAEESLSDGGNHDMSTELRC